MAHHITPRIRVLAMVAAVVAATTVGAAQRTGSVQGLVVDDRAQPLEGVRITVTSSALPQAIEGRSAVDGRFAIELPDLTLAYEVRFELDGYQGRGARARCPQHAGRVTRGEPAQAGRSCRDGDRRRAEEVRRCRGGGRGLGRRSPRRRLGLQRGGRGAAHRRPRHRQRQVPRRDRGRPHLSRAIPRTVGHCGGGGGLAGSRRVRREAAGVRARQRAGDEHGLLRPPHGRQRRRREEGGRAGCRCRPHLAGSDPRPRQHLLRQQRLPHGASAAGGVHGRRSEPARPLLRARRQLQRPRRPRRRAQPRSRTLPRAGTAGPPRS